MWRRRTEEEVLIFPPPAAFHTNREIVKNNLIIPASWPVGESTADLDSLASYLASVYASMMPPSDPQFLILRYTPPPQTSRGKRLFSGVSCLWLVYHICSVLTAGQSSSNECAAFGLISGTERALRQVACSCHLDYTWNELTWVHVWVMWVVVYMQVGLLMLTFFFDCLALWRLLTEDNTSPFSDVKERADFQELWAKHVVKLEQVSLTHMQHFVNRKS